MVQAGQLETCRVGAPGRRKHPQRALSVAFSTSVPWSDLKYFDHGKTMQCAYQPVPITLQRGTGKALAGKLHKTVQLYKTSINFQVQLETPRVSNNQHYVFLEEQARGKGNAAGQCMPGGSGTSAFGGFRNSCQDFIWSWSIFRAAGKTSYSLEDPSSPMIHTSALHTALTCATSRISLFFPGKDHSCLLHKGFEDAKSRPFSKDSATTLLRGTDSVA